MTLPTEGQSGHLQKHADIDTLIAGHTSQIAAGDVTNPASAAGVVLSATFVPKVAAQTAESAPFTVVEVTQKTGATAAPFKIEGNSFVNPGAGAGTYNHGTWIGYNVGRHSAGTVVNTAPGSFIGIEDNYFDAGGDNLYGGEFYFQVEPVGGATAPLHRPIYARGAVNSSGTIKQATVLLDIGTDGTGQFSVRSGQTNLLTMTQTTVTFSKTTTFTKGPVSLNVSSGQALYIANAAAGSQAGLRCQIATSEAFSLQANDLNTFLIYDKSGRQHMTINYGATAAAAVTTFASQIVTPVSVTTPSVIGALGTNKDMYIGPGTAAGAVIFTDGATNPTLQIDPTGNLAPKDGKAIVALGATGVYVGNTASNKFGFWGALPVIQQPRPTDTATIIALLAKLGLSA